MNFSHIIMVITRALTLGTIVYGVSALLNRGIGTSNRMITVVIVILYLSLDSFSGIFSKTSSIFCETICGVEDPNPPQLSVKTFLDNDSISTDVQEAVRLLNNEPVSSNEEVTTATAEEHVPVPAETEEGFVSYGSW